MSSKGRLVAELEEWYKEINPVMTEKLEVQSKVLSFQSEIKTTEWRIQKKAEDLAATNGEHTNTARMKLGMVQLKSRVLSLEDKLNEFAGRQAEVKLKEEALLAKINSSPLAPHLLILVENWNIKIEREEQNLKIRHLKKIVTVGEQREKCKTESNRLLCSVLEECYPLLRAHSHLTQPVITKYQEAMRSVEGSRRVEFMEEEEETTPNELTPVHAHLTPNMPFQENIKRKELSKKLAQPNLIPLPVAEVKGIKRGLPMRYGKAKARVVDSKENINLPALPPGGGKMRRTKQPLRPLPYQNTSGRK